MSATQQKIPGPDHPITVKPHPGRVRVSVGDHVIADTTRALALREASYPPMFYLPLADLDQSTLVASETTTYCPYKGDCSYFSIPAGGARGRNAVWSYEQPFEAVMAIQGHLAFYPDRVDAITEAD